MISRKHRVIFVHVRKSAGTTVKALFEDADDTKFGGPVCGPGWDDPEFAGYYRFAVVRNPFDRFVSGWKYLPSTRNRPIEDVLRHLPRQTPGGYVLAPGASLTARYHDGLEYLGWQVNRLKYTASSLVGRPPARRADGKHDHTHLTLQQWQMCLDPAGRFPLDRIVFYERLADGLADVFADLGRERPQIPHLRPTGRRAGYRALFTEEARRLFEQIYARDLAIWGYDFDTGLPGTEAASITDLSQIERAPASA
ncbi:MAG: sulfotransferase family 2 domain-containing protein [Paracoccaceae bacterium]|nr:sulfotransferase family 2 domain-containing protein [Paracoccaceae bacterium]